MKPRSPGVFLTGCYLHSYSGLFTTRRVEAPRPALAARSPDGSISDLNARRSRLKPEQTRPLLHKVNTVQWAQRDAKGANGRLAPFESRDSFPSEDEFASIPVQRVGEAAP